MIKSMTGYGRGIYKDDRWSVTVEIKTINHRYADINIKAPKELMFMENDIKKYIQQYINRGRVDIAITCERQDAIDANACFNEDVFKAYVALWQRLNREYGLDDRLRIVDILTLPEVLKVSESEEMASDERLKNAVFNCIEEGIKGVVGMRSAEGQHLYEDMLLEWQKLSQLVNGIREKAGEVVERYRDRLFARIRELMGGAATLDQERLMNEVAIYADRCDITEELARLNSHLAQFKKAVDSDEPVGRKLDFIAQEIYREFNTIASKATDSSIVSDVIEAKAATEKLREQIQNIE